MWLAERGWNVLAVDISETALQRAGEDARSRGVADRITFAHYDLSDSFPEGTFDLVSAQFLHSTVRLDRPAILKRAADAVSPGGLLLIVDHGEAPPWAAKDVHDHVFPDAETVVDELALPALEWERLRVEVAARDTTGPDGQRAILRDNLIVLRRR
jgi:SAM-dependent methyltransferase